MRVPLALLPALLTITLTAPATAHAGFGFARTDIPLAAGPSTLAVGDVDGRNGPDIVATMYSASKIAVMLNNGDGTFGAPTYFPGCAGPYGTKIGDVTTNGSDLAQDGKPDVVTACDSRKVARMAGNGAGGFGAAVETQNAMTGQPLQFSDPIELANVRLGGGPPLLMVQTDYYNSINDQGKVLCASWDWATIDCLAHPAFPRTGGAMTSGRLNGTARDQIIVGGGAKGIAVFGVADNVPNGSATMSLWTASERDSGLPNPSYGRGFRRLADVNGDGHLDIVASDGDGLTGTFGIQLWGAAGIADLPAVTHVSGAGLGPVVVGDFSGDGHPDVLGVTAFGRVLAHAGDGLGGFDAGTDVPLIGYENPAFSTNVAAEPADVDCDGRPDAVISDYASSAIEVLHDTQAPGTPQCNGVTLPVPVTTPASPIPLTTKVLPLGGVKYLPASVRAGATGTVVVGAASNPPTAAVDLTLTAAPAGAAGAAVTRKAVKLGAAHVVIPKGTTRKLTVRLNAVARRQLRHGSVKTKLTVVATGTDGSRASTTRRLTLRPAARRRRS